MSEKKGVKYGEPVNKKPHSYAKVAKHTRIMPSVPFQTFLICFSDFLQPFLNVIQKC